MNDQTLNQVVDSVRQDQLRRQEILRQSLIASESVDAQRQIEANRIAKERGLPSEFVASDLDRLKAEQRHKPETLETLVNNFPKTEEWLRKPENAALVKEDVGYLTRGMDILRAGAGGIVSSLVGRPLENVGTFARKTAEASALGYIKEEKAGTLGVTDYLFGAPSIGLAELLGETLETSGKGVEIASKAIDIPAERDTYGTHFTRALASGFSYMIASAINPALGLGVMSADSASQQAQAVRDNPDMDPREAVARMTAAGVGGGLLEKAQLGMLLKGVRGLRNIIPNLPPALQSKYASKVIEFGKGAVAGVDSAPGIVRVPGQIAAAGGTEILQETLESLLNDAINVAAGDPNAGFLQDWKQEAAIAGPVGGAMRALVLTVEGRRGRHQELRKTVESHAGAVQGKQQMLAAKEALSGMNLAHADPETLRDLLSAGDLPEGDVRLDSVVVTTLFQSGVNTEEFFKIVPEAREQFEQSRITGEDVILPANKLAVALASDKTGDTDFLTDFIKADPEGPTAAEALGVDQEEYRKRIEELVREMQDWEPDYDPSNVPTNIPFDQQIERRVAAMLTNVEAMGEKVRTAEAAATEAALYGSFVRQFMARDEGTAKAARDVFERAFTADKFEIKGPGRVLLEPPAGVVGSEDFYIDRLRNKIKLRQRAEAAKEKRAQEKKDLLGKAPAPRAAATPRPILSYLAKTGIDRSSKVLGDLKAIGITPKNTPRLFRAEGKGGRKGLDNIPVDEIESALDVSGIFSRDADLNGYVDQNELLDYLRDETFGSYVQTEEQRQKSAQDEYDQQVLDVISNAGLDIQTASNDQIKQALEAERQRYRAQEGDTYYQDAVKDFRWTDDIRAGVTYQKEVGDGVYFEASKTMRENLEGIPDDQFDDLQFEMDDAADEYIQKMRSAINEVLGRFGYKIHDEDKSRQSKSVYWEIASIDADTSSDEYDPIKVRFSDHPDYHGGNNVRLFWGQSVESASKEILEELGINVQRDDSRILYQSSEQPTEMRGSIELKKDQGGYIITLAKTADSSTFLHETAHLFLELFSTIAQHKEAGQSVKDDFAKTLQWLGVDSFDKVQVQHHEQFARGFEAYLFEGKPPSRDLVPAFERFKLWLVDVYRSLKALNVTLSDDMRGVFDRLLATNDAIDDLRSEPLIEANMASLELLTDEERARYEQMRSRAFEEAKGKLFRQAYRQMKRQETQWWKDESAKVQAEIEAELQRQPVYKAIQFMQTGNGFDGQSLGFAEFKLSVKSLEQSIGKDAKYAGKYLPRGIRAKEGGLPVDLVADMFGFKNVDAFIQAIMNAKPYKLELAERVEMEMIGRHGDMLNDGTIERKALEMALSQMPDANMIELDALSRLSGTDQISESYFRDAAKLLHSRLSVDRAIKPDTYLNAARKALRDYTRLVTAMDFENPSAKDLKDAVAAKRREILNRHLFRLARDSRDEVGKAINKFRDLQKQPPKRKKPPIDPEYHQKIWELLAKYDISPRMSEARRTRLELAALADWIERQKQDENAALLMPPQLTSADGKTHYKDMTLGEFRALKELVLNLEHQGRVKTQLQIAGQKRDLEQVVGEMVGVAEKLPLVRYFDPNKALTPVIKFVNRLDATATKMAQYMVKLDNGDNFGVWTRTVLNPMNQAIVARGIRAHQEAQRWKGIVDAYLEGSGWNSLQKVVPGLAREPFDITKERALMIAAYYTGTVNTRTKLLAGYKKQYGWDEDYINRILSTLTKRDWEFVMEMRDYLDSFWPETSEVEKRRYGYPPEKQEPLPDQEFVTADGEKITVRGGYMRIYYDPDLNTQAHALQQKERFDDLRMFKSGSTQTKNGSMIEQVDGVERPMLLSLDNVASHVHETVTYITMAETVDNVLKVTNNKDIQQVLFERMGSDAQDMLRLWIDDAVAGGALSGDGISRMLRMLRANWTLGKLTYKPLTAFVQISGVVQAFGDPDVRPGMAYAFGQRMSQPAGVVRSVLEKSPYMKEREFIISRDIGDAIAYYRTRGAFLSEKVAMIGMYGIVKVQQQVDVTIWTAAYDVGIKRGLSEADAIQFADNAVDRNSGGGNVTNLAATERGTWSNTSKRQELVKALTPLYSYFNAKYNFAKNLNVKYQTGRISGFDLAFGYIVAFFLEGLVSAAMMGQLDFDQDDDDEITASEAALGVAAIGMSQASASIPFLRNVWSGAEGFSQEMGAIGQLGNIGDVAADVYRLAEGDPPSEQKLIFDTVDAVNILLPVPASAIKQFYRGLNKEDGSIVDYFVYSR